MSKESKLELDGKIVEVLPAGKFKVELKDVGAIILCYKSGKMKMSHISVITDDWVRVEVSPYDMSQGRITYRYNQSSNGQLYMDNALDLEKNKENVNKKYNGGFSSKKTS